LTDKIHKSTLCGEKVEGTQIETIVAMMMTQSSFSYTAERPNESAASPKRSCPMTQPRKDRKKELVHSVYAKNGYGAVEPWEGELSELSVTGSEGM
jgi:hypothetical protein